MFPIDGNRCPMMCAFVQQKPTAKFSNTILVADNWLWSSNYQIIDYLQFIFYSLTCTQHTAGIGMERPTEQDNASTRQQPRTPTSHNCMLLHASFTRLSTIASLPSPFSFFIASHSSPSPSTSHARRLWTNQEPSCLLWPPLVPCSLH
jgi:hypothetical protein